MRSDLAYYAGHGINRDTDHLEILVRRQANERIALFLHGLRERLRTIGEPGDRMRLSMSREDIARFLGLALETVSRGFSKLQEDGVIDVVGRRIDVLKPDELRRLAHEAEHEEPRRRGRA